MLRNILIVSVFCFVTLFGLVACNKDDSPRVAMVNAEKVYQNSKLAQEGMKYVETLSEKFQARLEQMQQAVQAEPENQELASAFQAELMGLQGDFEARQVEAGNKLNKLFEEVIEEYRAQNKLEVILPSQVVLSSRAGADVTDAIIQLLDSKNIDYGSTDISTGGAPKAPTEDTPAATEAAPGQQPAQGN